MKTGAADRNTGQVRRHTDRLADLHLVGGRLVWVVGGTARTVGLTVAGTVFEELAEGSRDTADRRPPEVEHSHNLSHMSELRMVNEVHKSTNELGLLLAGVRSSVPHIAAWL